MFGALGVSCGPEPAGQERVVSWENVHDDGSRAELLGYRSDLMRLDECGPSADLGYVL